MSAMRRPILILNAGSSSVKFSMFDAGPGTSLIAGPHGQVSGLGKAPRLEIKDGERVLVDRPCEAPDHKAAISAVHEWLTAHISVETGLAGVGHRVVHGGTEFSAPVRVDGHLLGRLAALIPLAPLHQPHNIAAIRAVAAAAPDMPQVACFDTVFHHSQPALARQFALPRALTERGIRRYGFHGLSYEYIVSRLSEIAPENRRRPDRCRPSRQRRQPMCDRRRQKRRDDDELHAGRRPRHGHPVRRP